MRNSYLICYDILDEKRPRKIFKATRSLAITGNALGDHSSHRGRTER
jgi:hypothetical protein